ncbi:RelA/SpoT family protein [Salibacter sp.]|uniref:RelA/SpoT family protein n=1 Tax=Salibacter sp. TaxID=2010995 RepID=UPI00286FFB99|nr:RelA/SpoT family protein [Salibacter sp.]MDR9397585.1 RelA/SpoT family protein [Salibacter sp.]
MSTEVQIDEEAEKKAIIREYRRLLRAAKVKKGDKDFSLIRKAFDIAREAHFDVRRKSGESYIFHPLAVARIVAEDMGLGTTSIACALLHDVVEDTDLEIEDIEDLFSEKIARIIDGLTKIEEVFEQGASLQAENFRKIILTLADDVRVILIKLADRLHNMRTLDHMRKDKQLKIASETLYIYAPLAHRLGLYNIKSELEDLALKYKIPSVYKDISTKLQKTKAVRTRFINRFTLPVRRELDKMGIEYEVKSRTKSIYSIWNKMRSKNIPFEEVYDLFAIRVIINTPLDREKADCWKVYSVITDFYQPNPDRLRDWISTPKANGYESLHTTVMSPTGKWVEVQIRSKRMDEIAEKGYAAHWKYKEDSQHEGALDEWISRVREVLESPETNAVDFVDDFKLNLFAKEIFVFTPKGDIKSLPHNATALDFAYEIHTELGNRCVGAKVNQKLVPISHPLDSGDQVQIVTSKAQTPKFEWLEFVVTAKAKSSIKASIREEKKKVGRKGRKMLEATFKELGIEFNDQNLHTLTQIHKISGKLELFYRVGKGSIDPAEIGKLTVHNGFIQQRSKTKKNAKSLEEIVQKTRGKKDPLVLSTNQKQLNYKLSTCCNPIPGDDVVGFITNDGTIYIHRTNCPNVVPIMSNYGYRVVKAKWDKKEAVSFQAGIQMNGFDRTGIVNDITKVISNEMNVSMRSITFDNNDGVFEGKVFVYVNDTSHLKNLQDKLRNVEGVMKVNRIE